MSLSRKPHGLLSAFGNVMPDLPVMPPLGPCQALLQHYCLICVTTCLLPSLWPHSNKKYLKFALSAQLAKDGKTFKNLRLPNDTRWRSFFDGLVRLLEAKDSILNIYAQQEVFSKLDTATQTLIGDAEFWKAASWCKALLQPMAAASLHLESDSATLSDLYMHWSCIYKAIIAVVQLMQTQVNEVLC